MLRSSNLQWNYNSLAAGQRGARSTLNPKLISSSQKSPAIISRTFHSALQFIENLTGSLWSRSVVTQRPAFYIQARSITFRHSRRHID